MDILQFFRKEFQYYILELHHNNDLLGEGDISLPLINKKNMEKEKKEKMVSIFDPAVNAYRDVPLSIALRYIKEAKELEKRISEEENNEN